MVLAACCDVDGERAEAHRRDFGFARAFTDAAAMLDAEKPDAVVVVVPVSQAAEVASLVLGRGRPLLLEKPPGATLAEVDRLIAIAERAGGVPHQVAFNRRYAPLVREARRRIESLDPNSIQHFRYEMVRVDRRDPDFSTTAIHGIDAVRYLAAGDYARVRFSYQDLAGVGPGVANIFMDAQLASGATAHLGFLPAGGVVAERAEVHARDHTLFVEVPMWAGFDSPGRLQHLVRGALQGEVRGEAGSLFEQGGFLGQLQAFLDDLRSGRPPRPGLRDARQSVAVAEAMRSRQEEYRP